MKGREYISTFLIFAHLVAVFQFTVPFLTYYANYHYFSDVICVNKNKPEMHCNGRCQLKKMIKHEHAQAASHGKSTIVHAQKIDFFCLRHRTLIADLGDNTRSVGLINDEIHSLFIDEPPSPPPQIG